MNDELTNVLNIISIYSEGNLYFHAGKPHFTLDKTYCFVDMASFLVYNSYCMDFGPISILNVVAFFETLKSRKLKMNKKPFLLYCNPNSKNLLNAAFLVGTYLICHHDLLPSKALQMVSKISNTDTLLYCDISINENVRSYLSLADCLQGFFKAIESGVVSIIQYPLIDRLALADPMKSDLHWIIDNKIAAISTPVRRADPKLGRSPYYYLQIFQRAGIKTVIRLNEADVYDRQIFIRSGVTHHDIFFEDGTTPTLEQVRQFCSIVEHTSDAVAVHCRAGLGRTGTMICCYLIIKHHFTAKEAVAWNRIARPGSVFGTQQKWLERFAEALTAEDRDRYLRLQTFRKTYLLNLQKNSSEISSSRKSALLYPDNNSLLTSPRINLTQPSKKPLESANQNVSDSSNAKPSSKSLKSALRRHDQLVLQEKTSPSRGNSLSSSNGFGTPSSNHTNFSRKLPQLESNVSYFGGVRALRPKLRYTSQATLLPANKDRPNNNHIVKVA